MKNDINNRNMLQESMNNKPLTQIEVKENVSLAEHSTMYVGGPAKFFIEASSIEELREAIKFAKDKKEPIFVLGRGANTVFSDKGYDGVIINIKIKGIEIIEEADEYVKFKVGAGEQWDDFVKLSIENNLYGIENMSDIPGLVGASVVQNIGSYGQEVSETVEKIEAINMLTMEVTTFSNAEMNFRYRESRFNDPLQDKDKFAITSAVYKLNKNGKINASFGDVKKYLSDHNITNPDLKTIREVLINIRNSKFPYPDKPENGSCGSFFNADVTDEKTYQAIVVKLRERGFIEKADYLEKMKASFLIAQGYKVPYGILIDTLGYRGKKRGGAEISKQHANILRNSDGKATAEDVYSLAKEVVAVVWQEYGIRLNIEPEMVGFDKN